MPSNSSDVWLELAARFSIVASVLVITYFFIYTAWRIVRVPNNPWPWIGGVGNNRPEIHQTPTQMPFTFKLKEDTVNHLNRFSFHMYCPERLCTLRLFWAVDASYLFKVINFSSWDILRDLEDYDFSGENIDDKPYLCLESLNSRSHIDKSDDSRFEDNVTVSAPKCVDWRSLKNQYKYPLAIFFLKSLGGSPENNLQSAATIVGLCVILHVKNETIPRHTAVLGQYIKLSNGQAHMLQTLFVMDGVADDKAGIPTSELDIQPFSDVMCSVCQSLPVSRAIIPCRHVCLCAQCFGKVDTCPICRGPISCFFKTRNEEYLEQLSSASTEETRPRPFGEVITGWNDNVNAAMGF